MTPALSLRIPSPLQELHDGRLLACGVRLYLKRDDLIHPEISGNKWRKLKYNLRAAADQGYTKLLTFGGAYSNHIRATAAAGYYFGFSTVGVIRGEEHLPLNPSLAYAARRGMALTYLDRTAYRDNMNPRIIASLHRRFDEFYLLPEGGSNALAVQGCAELPGEIDAPFDILCCACGTGGTLAGLAAGLRTSQRAIGFSLLKGGEFLADDVREFQQAAYGKPTGNWTIEYGYHFGGYAKRNARLNEFIADFRRRHGIRLEWIYVAKMLYGIFDMAGQGAFPKETTIVAVITGPAE